MGIRGFTRILKDFGVDGDPKVPGPGQVLLVDGNAVAGGLLTGLVASYKMSSKLQPLLRCYESDVLQECVIRAVFGRFLEGGVIVEVILDGRDKILQCLESYESEESAKAYMAKHRTGLLRSLERRKQLLSRLKGGDFGNAVREPRCSWKMLQRVLTKMVEEEGVANLSVTTVAGEADLLLGHRCRELGDRCFGVLTNDSDLGTMPGCRMVSMSARDSKALWCPRIPWVDEGADPTGVLEVEGTQRFLPSGLRDMLPDHVLDNVHCHGNGHLLVRQHTFNSVLRLVRFLPREQVFERLHNATFPPGPDQQPPPTPELVGTFLALLGGDYVRPIIDEIRTHNPELVQIYTDRQQSIKQAYKRFYLLFTNHNPPPPTNPSNTERILRMVGLTPEAVNALSEQIPPLSADRSQPLTKTVDIIDSEGEPRTVVDSFLAPRILSSTSLFDELSFATTFSYLFHQCQLQDDDEDLPDHDHGIHLQLRAPRLLSHINPLERGQAYVRHILSTTAETTAPPISSGAVIEHVLLETGQHLHRAESCIAEGPQDLQERMRAIDTWIGSVVHEEPGTPRYYRKARSALSALFEGTAMSVGRPHIDAARCAPTDASTWLPIESMALCFRGRRALILQYPTCDTILRPHPCLLTLGGPLRRVSVLERHHVYAILASFGSCSDVVWLPEWQFCIPPDEYGTVSDGEVEESAVAPNDVPQVPPSTEPFAHPLAEHGRPFAIDGQASTIPWPSASRIPQLEQRLVDATTTFLGNSFLCHAFGILFDDPDLSDVATRLASISDPPTLQESRIMNLFVGVTALRALLATQLAHLTVAPRHPSNCLPGVSFLHSPYLSKEVFDSLLAAIVCGGPNGSDPFTHLKVDLSGLSPAITRAMPFGHQRAFLAMFALFVSSITYVGELHGIERKSTVASEEVFFVLAIRKDPGDSCVGRDSLREVPCGWIPPALDGMPSVDLLHTESMEIGREMFRDDDENGRMLLHLFADLRTAIVSSVQAVFHIEDVFASALLSGNDSSDGIASWQAKHANDIAAACKAGEEERRRSRGRGGSSRRRHYGGGGYQGRGRGRDWKPAKSDAQVGEDGWTSVGRGGRHGGRGGGNWRTGREEDTDRVRGSVRGGRDGGHARGGGSVRGGRGGGHARGGGSVQGGRGGGHARGGGGGGGVGGGWRS